MVFKLYGSPGSTCTRRVSAVLHEKKIPFEFHTIDIPVGENKAPEYLEKQPFGQVPYIDDDGFILYESRAIAWYISTKYADQGTPLIPSSLQGQALVQQALSVEISHFNHWADLAITEGVRKPRRGLSPDLEAFRNAIAGLEHRLDAYEQILRKTWYLAGDELTLADLSHLPYGDLLKAAGSDVLQSDNRPNVKRWYTDLQSRGAWQANKAQVTIYKTPS